MTGEDGSDSGPSRAEPIEEIDEAEETGRLPGRGPGDREAAFAEAGKQALRLLGQRLRRARNGRFTVESLADRSGVSSGLISQIERGVGNPSFGTLLKLATTLGLPLASLFNDHEVDEGRMVVRKDERRTMTFPRSGLMYELLTPDFQRDSVFFRTELQPGFDNEASPGMSLGRQSVHVLNGAMEAGVGPQVFHLTSGDTITYDAELPHWWRNRGRRPVALIVHWSARVG